MEITLYEIATGKMGATITAPNGGGLLRQLSEGQDAVFGSYSDVEFWVDQGRIAPRPRIKPLPTSGQAPFSLDLSGLPAGAVLTVINEAGEVVEVTDFTEPLECTDPGKYTLAIKAPFPYFDVSGALELSAPGEPE